MFLNTWKNSCLKHFNGSKSFIKYSDNMHDIYNKIEECNPNKKGKILTVFDDTIATTDTI